MNYEYRTTGGVIFCLLLLLAGVLLIVIPYVIDKTRNRDLNRRFRDCQRLWRSS